MDKKRAIQIMTKAAEAYRDNLEDQKVLFLYGIPSEVKRQLRFVQDRNTKLNVPNTLLKKDIRDVTSSPMYKVYAVISKKYKDDRYSVFAKLDKSIDIEECYFTENMENIIKRDNN